MGSIREAVRKLRRTGDEKLLIKFGVTTEDGCLRKEGRFLVADKVFAGVSSSDVRKAIIDDLKDVEKENAKNCKK